MIGAGASAARRSPNPSRLRITDQRIHTILPAGTYDKLLDRFWRDLQFHPRLPTHGISPSISAWCRFVFSLTTYGGQAGPDAWREILSIRFRHISCSGARRIFIPRKGGEIPIYVPPVVSLCALSMCRLLMRSRSAIGNLGQYPPDGFILPGRNQSAGDVTAEEQQVWKDTFAGWLSALSASCGARVSVGQLLALSRARLAEQYSPAVAGGMIGLHVSNPAPVSQFDTLLEYREQLDERSILSASAASSPVNTRRRKRKALRAGEKALLPEIPSRNYERRIARIRRIVVRYSRADKRSAQARRKAVRDRLGKESMELRKRIGKRDRESWLAYSNRTKKSLLHAPDTVEMNMAILAEWLSWLIASRLPNTVEGYLNDVARFLRLIPFQPVFSLSEASIANVLSAIPIGSRSRARLVNTLQVLSTFIREELGIPTPSVAWWKFRFSFRIRNQPVLTQAGLSRLLAAGRRERKDSLAKTCAILMGYYFGLRVSEMCRLQMGDVWLAGTPTVFVWNSKRGSRRNVEVSDIPEDMLAILKAFFRKRTDRTGGDPGAPFLAREDDKPLSRRQVIRFLGRAMDRAGIILPAEEKRLIAHCLRHACANRWWALGVPLFEIARRLGHKSINTTMQNYLHISSFQQMEQMAEEPGGYEYLEGVRALGGILGLTTRGARYWLDRMAQKRILNRSGQGNRCDKGIPIKPLICCLAAEFGQMDDRLPE